MQEYLKKKGFTPSTINEYTNFIQKKFKPWLQANNIKIHNFEHENLMQYIRYRKIENRAPKTINAEIKIISHYLKFKQVPDVAEDIRIKGVQRRIPHDLLSEKQLNKIYDKFPESRNNWTREATFKRYRIILGLKIYQAMQLGELQKLKTYHLQLEKGKIHIPQCKRTNKRTLELKPFQILPLHEYIQTENLEKNDNLFKAKRLKRSIPEIKKMINRYFPKLKSIRQIRSSVITNWLKHNNLRQVQYMSGHRFVSSTEHYRTDNLKDLQKELEKHHPVSKF